MTGRTRPPIMLFVLGGAFLLLMASLVIGSLTKPEFPPYSLTVPFPVTVGDSLIGPAVYTLDASATDRWRYFDFSRNAAVDPAGAGGTGDGWDIAFRRFHLVTGEGGGIADLGPVPFDSVNELPATGYRGNDVGSDTTNPGVGKWYHYSMLSHLLTSKHRVYAVRTGRSKYAKLEILAYYCSDVGTACITFRYAYQGDGSRRIAR